MNKFIRWLKYVIIAFICLVITFGLIVLASFLVAKFKMIGFTIVLAIAIGTLLFLGDKEDCDE